MRHGIDAIIMQEIGARARAIMRKSNLKDTSVVIMLIEVDARADPSAPLLAPGREP
jgi:hypothetical protein